MSFFLTKSKSVNQYLSNLGIHSWFDVLNRSPRTYQDISRTSENNLIDKSKIIFYGKLKTRPLLSKFSHVSLVKFCFLTDNNFEFNIEAFNRPYLIKYLSFNCHYVINGIYNKEKNKINLISISKVVNNSFNLKPVYSLPTGFKQYVYYRIVLRALEHSKEIFDFIPEFFKKKYRLLDKCNAIYFLHKPRDFNQIKSAKRTLKYEECLKFILKNILIKKNNEKLQNNKDDSLIKTQNINDFIKKINYKLTNSQQKALEEILIDMNKKQLMYRLLQGDVGSGKTLVAILALYGNYLRNNQGVFMAPTDVLARQHFSVINNLFSNTNIRVGILLGHMSKKEKEKIVLDVANKKIDVLVGTHALFSSTTKYPKLGLIVIDEQHRFGVNQRLMLMKKNKNADVLLMSATPIPRSLALSIYGDLSISTLNEFPFGERKVKTFLINFDDEIIIKSINESIEKKHQVYIIAPTIDKSDNYKFSVKDLFAKFLNIYPNKVLFLHGRLSSEEKNKILKDFQNNEYSILISTTVVEVGLDVKNANLMIIYNAGFFGLATLHQLRGRIGRNGVESKCLLICNNNLNEKERLNVLVNSNDGFYIANEDLKIRGPGELSGFKQSGLPDFNFVNIVDDFKIFECAKEDAKFILDNEQNKDFEKILNLIKSETFYNKNI